MEFTYFYGTRYEWPIEVAQEWAAIYDNLHQADEDSNPEWEQWNRTLTEVTAHIKAKYGLPAIPMAFYCHSRFH